MMGLTSYKLSSVFYGKVGVWVLQCSKEHETKKHKCDCGDALCDTEGRIWVHIAADWWEERNMVELDQVGTGPSLPGWSVASFRPCVACDLPTTVLCTEGFLTNWMVVTNNCSWWGPGTAVKMYVGTSKWDVINLVKTFGHAKLHGKFDKWEVKIVAICLRLIYYDLQVIWQVIDSSSMCTHTHPLPWPRSSLSPKLGETGSMLHWHKRIEWYIDRQEYDEPPTMYCTCTTILQVGDMEWEHEWIST